MAALVRSVSRSGLHVLQKQVGVCGSIGSVRWLNLQEYQSKRLMEDNGINVQNFRVAETLDQAKDIAQSFDQKEYVIKAQVLAGGRGKGTFSNGFKGGVHLTKIASDIPAIVDNMLGHSLVTKQTPKDGVNVKKVMVAQALDITRETYFAILLDRDHGGPVMVGSPQGGVDIEEVAEKTPEAIFTDPIDIFTGITDEQAQRMAANLEFKGPLLDQAAEQMKRLYELFCKVDATQVEINPFGETPDGEVVCFDAKMNFDDNAAFRQKEIFAMEDKTESDPREVLANHHQLNYIAMDGNIACLVNGAGLAMATMDMVKLCGGEPANFLDVGGAVSEAQVAQAFKILTSDPKVKTILVNVFGGIVNCATIASGITKACKTINLSLPVIVRLEGNNVDAGKAVLAESGLPVTSAEDLNDAADKAISSLFHDERESAE